MAELKTKPTSQSVIDFLNKVEPQEKREDAFEILQMMKQITSEAPKMWGPSIVGFGKYHYKYASGHEGDMCIAGFSPRKQALTIYLMPDFENYSNLIKKLGKHKATKACLYIKKLSDVDKEVLKELIQESIERVKKEN